MKKIYISLIIGIILYQTTVNAQSKFTFEISQLYTSFTFVDSEGYNLNSEYTGIYNNAYALGYSFYSNNGLIISSRLGMRKAGASLIFDDTNYDWDLQYADIRLGFGYIYNASKLKPYLIASGYSAYLLSGEQVINNAHFDVKKSGSINELDYGISITPGVQLEIDKTISAFFEFNYLMGLANLDNNENQKASNMAYGVSLGLLFSIGK